MTKEQAVDFFATLYRGEHHIPGRRCGGKENVRDDKGGVWSVSHHGEMATFDDDELTRLVLLAHERGIRAWVRPGGPWAVRVFINARDPASDSMSRTHPTIEEAVDKSRSHSGDSWSRLLGQKASAEKEGSK